MQIITFPKLPFPRTFKSRKSSDLNFGSVEAGLLNERGTGLGGKDSLRGAGTGYEGDTS